MRLPVHKRRNEEKGLRKKICKRQLLSSYPAHMFNLCHAVSLHPSSSFQIILRAENHRNVDPELRPTIQQRGERVQSTGKAQQSTKLIETMKKAWDQG
jgi:hypothetical protein